MKFLITGGAGSVGRDLTSAILELGHEVRVLDAKVDPAGIPGHANLELVEGRVEDVAVVGKAVEGVDVVVHLAWSFSDNPRDLIQNDLAGQITLLDAAEAAKVSQFVYISSAIIYGAPTSYSIIEDGPCFPEKARKPFYGAAKLAAEKFALAFGQARALPVTIFRFWWSYGQEIGGRHLRDMLQRAASGQPLAVPAAAGGSFLHHDDLTNAILLAFRNDRSHGQAFNLSTVYLEWRDIAGMVIDVTESSSRLDVISPAEWEGPRFLADSWRLCSCKAEQLFGWRTQFSFESAKAGLKGAIGRCIGKS